MCLTWRWSQQKDHAVNQKGLFSVWWPFWDTSVSALSSVWAALGPSCAQYLMLMLICRQLASVGCLYAGSSSSMSTWIHLHLAFCIWFCDVWLLNVGAKCKAALLLYHNISDHKSDLKQYMEFRNINVLWLFGCKVLDTCLKSHLHLHHEHPVLNNVFRKPQKALWAL